MTMQMDSECVRHATAEPVASGFVSYANSASSCVITYAAADRLVSASVCYGQGDSSSEHITETFAYDPNGALTNWGSANTKLVFAYDALGRFANGS